MSSACHEPVERAHRSFLISPHVADGDGVLAPERPAKGPCWREGGVNCRISLHGWRARKSGPEYPLRVMRCRGHSRWFTVYPPGFAPYQRAIVAPVGSDGEPLLGTDAGVDRSSSTLFEAAVDAAAGIAWSRTAAGGSTRWWSTQRRRLRRAISLCGLGLHHGERTREQFAQTLGVDGLVLAEQARAVSAKGVGYVGQGKAVMEVLLELGESQRADHRLLNAGYVAGVWGRPAWWDPKTETLRFASYRVDDTRPPQRPP